MSDAFRTPYAGYDVLSKWDSPSWDPFTRDVVARRLRDVPSREFFTEHEWHTLEAVCARLLPQPERGAAPVPIAAMIDRKVHAGRGEGYLYEDMPDLQSAWRLGLLGIEQEAFGRDGRGFTELDASEQDALLRAVERGEVNGAAWHRVPPRRFFMEVLRTVVSIYYAHPAAWSEVGFGGPASPRGYVRRDPGMRDRWEARELWNPTKTDRE